MFTIWNKIILWINLSETNTNRNLIRKQNFVLNVNENAEIID